MKWLSSFMEKGHYCYWIIGLVSGAYLAITLFWIIPVHERALLHQQRSMLRQQTETLWSIINHLYNLSQKGLLSQKDAQQEAIRIASHIRYGSQMKNYFVIMDGAGRCIMHPYRSDLVGKDLTGLRDDSGKYFIRDMIKEVRDSGEGFVTYRWQYFNQKDKILPKLSYVRLFRPWNWIIITGTYLTGVSGTDSLRRQAYVVLAILVVSSFILARLYMALDIRGRLKGKCEGMDGDSQSRFSVGLKTWFLSTVSIGIVVVILAACFLFYRDLYRLILSGFNKKIYAISTITGLFISGQDHYLLYDRHQHGKNLKGMKVDEHHPLYKRYIVPMKQVMRINNLTYLYTQVLEDTPPFCRYVLDATEGEDHTPIGYRDRLPWDDYLGGRRVMDYGVTHIGKVQPTGRWGLLKVSYAPIYDDNGTIRQMAGCDVNLSIIRRKTQVALYILFVVGLLSILAAYLLIGYISSHFVEPLTAMKNNMLLVCAPEGVNYHLENEKTKYFASLFRQIGELQGWISSEISFWSSASRQLGILILAQELDNEFGSGPLLPGCIGAYANKFGSKKSGSGWQIIDGRVVLWLARGQGEVKSAAQIDPLIERLSIREGLSLLAAEQSGLDPWELLQAMVQRGDACLMAMVKGEPGDRRICYVASRPVTGWLFGDQDMTQPREVVFDKGRGEFRLSYGEYLLVSDFGFNDVFWKENPIGSQVTDVTSWLKALKAKVEDGSKDQCLIFIIAGGI